MIVLSLSDQTVQFIYSPQVRYRFPDVDLIFGCGDLDYYYLEYVLNALNRPLFFVRGNHDKVVEYNTAGQRTGPAGGIDLHRRVVDYKGLLLAGVEGSLKYRRGVFQYTQGEMLQHVLALVPGLLLNRLRRRKISGCVFNSCTPSRYPRPPGSPSPGDQSLYLVPTCFSTRRTISMAISTFIDLIQRSRHNPAIPIS